mmetsp:Transcript_42491/g.85927  ORF Transcript_42491/g.85927 Transcript_42491/m.85927 type:complete len:109 (+) Transcript_42491:1131-1457(+)
MIRDDRVHGDFFRVCVPSSLVDEGRPAATQQHSSSSSSSPTPGPAPAPAPAIVSGSMSKQLVATATTNKKPFQASLTIVTPDTLFYFPFGYTHKDTEDKMKLQSLYEN